MSDVVFQFGSAEAVTGGKCLGDMVNSVFGGLGTIDHDFFAIWQCDDISVCQAAAICGLTDSRSRTLPAAVILEGWRNGLVGDCWICQDVRPLWAPP